MIAPYIPPHKPIITYTTDQERHDRILMNLLWATKDGWNDGCKEMIDELEQLDPKYKQER